MEQRPRRSRLRSRGHIESVSSRAPHSLEPHWVRDIDFDEDRSQVRTAAGPRIMASLRNLVITIFRLAGASSIATVLRYHAPAAQAALSRRS